MFSVKLSTAVKKSNAVVSAAASGAAAGVSGAAAGIASKTTKAVSGAAHAAKDAVEKVDEWAADTTWKAAEKLKIDHVASSIHTHIKDFQVDVTTATSAGTRAVARGVRESALRVSLGLGIDSGGADGEKRERRWDEYGSDEDDEGELCGGEGELTALEKEVLIAGLTDSEDIGPAVQAVHERGVSDTLVHALEELSSARKEDIVHACDQERVFDMMRNLQLVVAIQQQAGDCESRLAKINTRLQSDGAHLLQAQSEVADLRQRRGKLDEACVVLDESIAMMRLCCRIRHHLGKNKVHAALKALQRLEAELAAQSLRDTAISRLLQASLPVLADEVKAQALKEFNSWLGEVRQMARKVGLALLEGTLERGVQEEVARQVASQCLQGGGTALLFGVGGERDGNHLVAGSQAWTGDATRPRARLEADGEKEEGDNEYELCGVPMDMGPLYRCLYLFRCLGQVQALRTHMRSTRRSHAAVDLAPPDLSEARAGNRDLNSCLRPFLESAVGFFVLDQTISGLSGGAFPRSQTEQEWMAHSSVMVSVLTEACEISNDSAALVQLRSVVNLVCASLDRYKLTTRALRAAFDSQLPRYVQVLLDEGRQDVHAAMQNDPLTPMKVDKAVDYARLVVDLKLQDYVHPLSQSPAPFLAMQDGTGKKMDTSNGHLAESVTMMFSSSVPRLIQSAKNFVFDLASFVDLSSPHCVQVLLQALARFFDEVVNQALVGVLENHRMCTGGDANKGHGSARARGVDRKNATESALHAMQIYLNADVLAKETAGLMHYGASLSLTPDDSMAAAHQAQASARMFLDTKMLGEDKMFGHSATTVHTILAQGDSEFDWMPTKVETHPSNYILELSSYLMATFPAFSALPTETREALYYITCKSIASHLLAQPLQTRVRKIQLAAFSRANVDLEVPTALR